MGDVGQGVGLLGGRERAARPVVLLALLGERDPELRPQQGLQADLGQPQEARRDHGVEQAREGEAEVALERGHVVVGSVQDLHHPGIREKGSERRERAAGERVHQPAALLDADLHEADLLAVVVQAVRLRVEGESAPSTERCREFRQLRRGADPSRHAWSIGEGVRAPR